MLNDKESSDEQGYELDNKIEDELNVDDYEY